MARTKLRALRALSSLVAMMGVLLSPAAQALPSLNNLTEPCAQLDFTADQARIHTPHVTLVGRARLTCGSFRLLADELTLKLDGRHHFAMASAYGNVRLIEGFKLITAARLTLAGDSMTGVVADATLAVRRSDPPPVPDADGVPMGRNEVTAHGSLERHADGVISLAPADVTLCDCGGERPPSWRLDARKVIIHPGERASVLWPTVRVWLPVVGLVPITPPLLPMSLPLRPRAFGLLPPQLSFLGPPYPTIDQPLFIPLGPSWDVTVTPGVRTDWAAAPRLGLRLRFFPRANIEGALWSQWTHDYSGAMAKRAEHKDLEINPALAGDPTHQAYAQERAELTERVALGYSHRISWGQAQPARAGEASGVSGAWLAHGSWVSDDLVNSDLMVHPSERVATYLPSRTQLLMRHARGVVSLGIDHMLRLDNVEVGPVGKTMPNLSNVRGAESTTLQRLPFVQLALPHQPLVGPLSLDASVTASRYGSWTQHYGARAMDEPLALAHVALGVNAARALGPVRLRARVGSDTVAFETPHGSAIDAAPTADLSAELSFVRSFGELVHVVTPRVDVRVLYRPHMMSLLTSAASNDVIDEHMVRRATEQMRFGLRQVLWRRRPGPGRAELSVDVQLPLDLARLTLLQPQGMVQLLGGPLGAAHAYISLDPHRPGDAWVRDLQLSYSVAVRAARVWLNYLRIAPDADRFERSIYELSAPRHLLLPETGLLWGHMLRAGGELQLGETFGVTYALSAQLPRPNIPPGQFDPACHWGRTPRGRSCVTSHSLGVRYQSACQCWSVEASASAAPQDLVHTLRVQMVLSVAGVRVGASQF